MKPRQVADLIGFVSYFYATNRRLPERDLWQLAFRQSNLDTPRANVHVRRAFDTGRGTALGADTQLERQEEHMPAA